MKAKICAALVFSALHLAEGDVCGKKTVQKVWHGECTSQDAEATISSDCGCLDGLPHGKGWMLEPGISITQGVWRLGKKNGLMRYRTRSGFDYFGFYENDKQEGVGRLLLAAGSVVGEFKDDLIEGIAVSSDSSGGQYAGQYKKNKREGFGVERLPFGDAFKGEFVSNKYSGCGRYFRGGAGGFFASIAFGPSRDGLWGACNRSLECPLPLISCRCDMNEFTTGLVSDARFKQCAHDSGERAQQAASAALDLKRQIIEQLDSAELPGPGEDPDFGEAAEDGYAELPETEVEVAEEADEHYAGHGMAEVAMMVTIMIMPNGIAGGCALLPRKLHILVYATAVLFILAIVEVMVGIDFAYAQFRVVAKSLVEAYTMEGVRVDHTAELIRRGYVASSAEPAAAAAAALGVSAAAEL